jgi:5-methylcytosine-specific restriction enzyme A
VEQFPSLHSTLKSLSGRNPAWARDELILALDLYFRQNPSNISNTHPEIIELSNVLRSLPIFSVRPDPERFRNPNGVYMKLCNFLRFDPNYSGTGLQAGARAEEDIWNEFVNDKERLHQLANAIRAGSVELSQEQAPLAVDEDEEIEISEGRVLLKLHKVRERNKSLVKKKKAHVLTKTGKLACEVCGFDFKIFYGEMGEGFIECHHDKPISQMQPGEKTTLQDLRLVCSNCHRMLHRVGETMTVEDLRTQLGR